MNLHTARLHLRPLVKADASWLARLNGDPLVMRYTATPQTAEEAATWLEERILPYPQLHPGMGFWATVVTATDEIAGFHLISHVQGESNEPQVGYRLFPEHWGRGYATEMTLALVDYARDTLKLPHLTANTHLENHASQQVLLKCGFERKGEKQYAGPIYQALGPVAYFEKIFAEHHAEH
jgi:RimJ/RimL family protein N-acetyltransferase